MILLIISALISCYASWYMGRKSGYYKGCVDQRDLDAAYTSAYQQAKFDKETA